MDDKNYQQRARRAAAERRRLSLVVAAELRRRELIERTAEELLDYAGWIVDCGGPRDGVSKADREVNVLRNALTDLTLWGLMVRDLREVGDRVWHAPRLEADA